MNQGQSHAAFRRLPCMLAALMIHAGAAAGAGAAQQADGKGARFFETNIRPVLANQCYSCHSAEAEEPAAELRLDTREGTRRALTPKKPGESALLSAARGEIAPKGKHKLSESAGRAFEQWIAMGAPDPRDSSGPQEAGDPDELWSLKPVRDPAVPEVEDENWPRNAIDRFILRRLEREGLDPVPEADRRTLIRRLYFDLTGLPPSPEAVERFVNDESPDAYRKLVDRLLDSPRFGERWGKHWLDVARYAESTGRMRNFTYPHAWRYRDWVVDSFNEGKPYDRFVREQIAGDLMEAEDWKQAQEQAMGTGFLALGPKDLIMGFGRQYWADVVDDQINAVSQGMLGLTASCARCHDHKFDPISIEEYYSLAGIFHSTEPMYGTQPGSGGGSNRHPSELLPLGPDAEKKHRAYEQYQKKLKELKKKRDKAQQALKKARKKDQDDKAKNLKQKLEQRKAALKEHKADAPEPPPYAMAVREKPEKKIGAARLYKRGNPRNRGDRVPRGFLSAVEVEDPPEIPDDRSGRLALAEWITGKSNPLTARVFVNRVWHYLFGRGIVRSVDNFGVTGDEPTHPALLDHLATRFMRNGWSIKGLIRRVVTSRTYRLSTAYVAENHRADPEASLRWRNTPRRLDAEAIRDAILSVSGRLSLRPPEGGSAVARAGGGCLVRQIDEEEIRVDADYRSVYLPHCRHFLPEMIQTFDGPAASLVTGARAVTNVPAQALFLLNDDFVVEQSKHAAGRLLKVDGLDDPGRVDRAYVQALSRPPSEAERARALRYIEKASKLAEKNEAYGADDARLAAWASFYQALFTSAEFRFLTAPAADDPPKPEKVTRRR